MINLLCSDNARMNGNVLIKQMRSGKLICESVVHNEVTADGQLAMLQALLSTGYTPTINGFRVYYNTTSYVDYDEYDYKKIVSVTGVGSDYSYYLELKFFLPSDQLAGQTLTGAAILFQDTSNTRKVFAVVDTSSLNVDTGQPALSPLSKTTNDTVTYIWRIGIRSEYKSVVS